MKHPISPEKVRELHARISGFSEDLPATPTYAPYTGEVIHNLPLVGESELESACKRARKAQKIWAALPASQRASVFKRYHDLVFKNQDLLADLIQLENGKSRLYAFEEVADTALVARFVGYHGPAVLRERRVPGVIPILTKTVIQRAPVGLVGMITPWNYPLNLPLGDAAAALMAGNGVILKPASQTSLTALAGYDLMIRAGLPEDLFQIVTGSGAKLAPALIDNVDYIQFTGGNDSGRSVAEQAASRLIGCSLELGGKNPGIVFDDAPFERAVDGIMRGIFGNTGQMCVHLERIYVQSGVYDRFVAALAKRTNAMKMAATFEYTSDIGSLTSPEQLQNVSAHVQDAVEKGATLITGGKHRPEIGPYFFEPTLLEGVTPEMQLYAEETFGPVASIYRFDRVEEVVERVNDSDFGLNASVWSRNVRKAKAVASQIESGTVNINESYAAVWGSSAAPQGGFKKSGLGRRHGAEAILKTTEARTVAVQRLLNIAPPKGVSDSLYVKVLAGALKLLKRIPGLR